MAVFNMGWCRIEGGVVPDPVKEYGSGPDGNKAFVNMPQNTQVFYGNPEVQIFNPNSVINGVVYKVVYLSEFGASSIHEIDANYASIINAIANYNRDVVISDAVNSANYYFEPFVLEESCVIFYADSMSLKFDHQLIVYVDEYATPNVVTVVGSYIGPPIPVGEAYNASDLDLYVIYSDGNKAMLRQGYTLDPADRIIHTVGSNVVKVTYISPTGTTFIASVIVPGIKNLTSITAVYDGPSVSYGQEAQRKYFVVIAHYSDGSSATITDFTFPSGTVVSETNAGVIPIYYKGCTTSATVPTYEVSSSRLMAYYNGPNVEVGDNIILSYCNIKIYYQSSDSYFSHYEAIPVSSCTLSTTTIDHEGINYITVQYVGKTGPVSTKMLVVGIKPEKILSHITAEYTGPEVVQGKTFSAERVVCKAYYSDGSVVVVRNFALATNVVSLVGPNEILVSFKDGDLTATATITVIGLEPDSTTESGYSPIYLQNNYPEATRLNNRYRGPAESYKHQSTNQALFENIIALYALYARIEKDFNGLIERMEGDSNVKTMTLNNANYINDTVQTWINDPRFTSGQYRAQL